MPLWKKDIYSYTDFRKFLRDVQKERVRRDDAFKCGAICRRLGLPRSRSYFSDVVKGRKVTAQFLEKFIDIFGLDKKEAQYFRLMALYGQTAVGEERAFLKGVLAAYDGPNGVWALLEKES